MDSVFGEIKKEEQRKKSIIYNNVEKRLDKFNIDNEFGRGTVHVCVNAFQELKKLTDIKDKTIPEYVFANRKVISLFLAGTMIVAGWENIKNFAANIFPDYTATAENVEPTVTLNEVHVVEQGDTLWDLANNAGCDISEIRGVNTTDPTYGDGVLDVGSGVIVPHKIAEKDLNKITMEKQLDDKSLYDFALENGTDVATLLKLNPDGLKLTKEGIEIYENNLSVPNFTLEKNLNVNNEETYKGPSI